jgi:hypothetical protein
VKKLTLPRAIRTALVDDGDNLLSAEDQIAEFIGKYTPELRKQLVECRAKLRSLFPRGYELVYDNYNALVFGIGPSERASDALVSIAGYPKWVTLFFLRGADLKDPQHLLEGKGTQVRSIRLANATHLEEPAVQSLIAQAVAPYKFDFRQAPPLTTVVKSVSARQRPRRPKTPDAGESKRSERPKKSSTQRR